MKHVFRIVVFLVCAGSGLRCVAQSNATQDYFSNWPKGYSPQEVGKALANHFVPAPHMEHMMMPEHQPVIAYPEICAWYGALTFAQVTHDSVLATQLKDRFEPLMDAREQAKQPPVGQHVDFSVFGTVPMELYAETKDPKYLALGQKYADGQWNKPDAQGMSDETRYWVDDMYMLIILQVESYRATGDPKYIDRAALEMTAYLDKMQEPNGLFYHAPDVKYFWGRGDGWFAAGMAEVLRSLPADHPKRARILAGYQKMMAGLLKYQGKDGMWRQLLDHEESWPETSSTGMFTFAMVTGVKNGWLDGPTYGPAARHAWIALVGYIDQNHDVTSICEGTGKQDSFDYYMLRKRKTGDFHGQSPVMWSATALLR